MKYDHPPKVIVTIVAILLASGIFAGCSSPKPVEPKTHINYFISEPYDIWKITSLSFVELLQEQDQPDITYDMTEVISTAIGSRRIFDVNVVWRDQEKYALMPLGDCQALTFQQISEIKLALGCDAVILGSIKSFSSYPHMQVNMRLRMYDLRNGKLVWGVDHAWDTREKDLEKRLKEYYEHTQNGHYKSMDWKLALVSPKAFEKFVAYEISQTLPKRCTQITAKKPISAENEVKFSASRKN